jgi:hypothetical protein
VIIRENTQLTEFQKRRVLERVEERSVTCASCGSGDFRVGEALELGFLFFNEEHGMYMVALTCKNLNCDIPRAGIRLHRSEFL